LGCLRLTLKPASRVANCIKPRSLACTIYSGILVRMISSTLPLRGMPTYVENGETHASSPLLYRFTNPEG
jgi:hypothetical protein